MVGGCSKSVIGHDLLDSLVYHSVVADPLYPIPYPHVKGYIFYFYQPMICEDQFAFSDTTQRNRLPNEAFSLVLLGNGA
jgi:hypothetical protein